MPTYTTPHGTLTAKGYTATFNPTVTGPARTDMVAVETEEEKLERENAVLKTEVAALEAELDALKKILDE